MMPACQRDAAGAVLRAQQAQIRTSRDQLLDELHICPVVLDVEHGVKCGAVRNPRRNRCGRFGSADVEMRFPRCVQFDPEHAADSHGALHSDRAAHQFDQSLADHEADAGAFLAARLLAEAIEGLEEVREFLGRQSFAGVPHADAHAVGIARVACHLHHTLRAIVLDGV